MPQCGDGIDNDGDGLIDFPDDPGCTSSEDTSEDSPPSPQCSDGRDNDGDGKIDYPNDPGCFAPNQDSEVDDCPSGPMCPQCSNGKDDDGNGKTDYPNDPGCTSAGDPTEFTENAAACGGTKIAQLTNGSADGMLDGTSTFTVATANCGGGTNASAIAYELHITDAKVVVATTSAGDPSVDTVLDIRGAMCTDPTSEIACNDNTNPADTSTLTSTVTAPLQPGTYYLIVEGFDASVTGAFHLDVQLLAGEGVTCTMDMDCGTGLVCNPAAGGGKVCSKPQCSDGSDNDADGKIDFPNDPGCGSAGDNDESDSCPSGSDCPACSNGSDDDGDGKIDYPADPSCHSAGGTSESCNSVDPVLALAGSDTSGTLVGAANDFEPSCVFVPGGLDQVYQIDLPATVTLSIGASNPNFDFFADVALYNSTCGGSDLACSADSITPANLPAGTYFIVVDDDDPTFGTPSTFDVTVSGTVAPGQACEGALFTEGVLTCGGGSVCGGSAGSQTCVPPQCSDGIDNNADGKIDYPNDPGCTDPTDNTETTVCPGANCPVCSNGSDDDGDTKIDFPADSGCASAGGTSEAFCATDTDTPGAITTGTTTSTFVGTTNTLTLDCGFGTAGDRSFALQLPVPVTTLTIDTFNSAVLDTVVELWSPQCTGEIQCNDDSGAAGSNDFEASITATNLAAGNYAVSVQTYDATSKTFKIDTHGVVAAGTACTSALFTGADPVLTCVTGTTCTGGKCQ